MASARVRTRVTSAGSRGPTRQASWPVGETPGRSLPRATSWRAARAAAPQKAAEGWAAGAWRARPRMGTASATGSSIARTVRGAASTIRSSSVCSPTPRGSGPPSGSQNATRPSRGGSAGLNTTAHPASSCPVPTNPTPSYSNHQHHRWSRTYSQHQQSHKHRTRPPASRLPQTVTTSGVLGAGLVELGAVELLVAAAGGEQVGVGAALDDRGRPRSPGSGRRRGSWTAGARSRPRSARPAPRPAPPARPPRRSSPGARSPRRGSRPAAGPAAAGRSSAAAARRRTAGSRARRRPCPARRAATAISVSQPRPAQRVPQLVLGRLRAGRAAGSPGSTRGTGGRPG